MVFMVFALKNCPLTRVSETLERVSKVVLLGSPWHYIYKGDIEDMEGGATWSE